MQCPGSVVPVWCLSWYWCVTYVFSDVVYWLFSSIHDSLCFQTNWNKCVLILIPMRSYYQFIFILKKFISCWHFTRCTAAFSERRGFGSKYEAQQRGTGWDLEVVLIYIFKRYPLSFQSDSSFNLVFGYICARVWNWKQKNSQNLTRECIQNFTSWSFWLCSSSLWPWQNCPFWQLLLITFTRAVCSFMSALNHKAWIKTPVKFARNMGTVGITMLHFTQHTTGFLCTAPTLLITAAAARMDKKTKTGSLNLR